MTAYVALLRAVNLGSHNKVGMAAWRAALEAGGMTKARTLLQSGNAVFESALRTSKAVESVVHAIMKDEVGVDTDVFVRSAKEWRAVVEKNPFPKEAKADPSHLVVLALRSKAAAAEVAALEAAIVGRERVKAVGSELYAVYPDGIGRSKLTIALIERKLGVRGSGRNWNTALKILQLLEE